MLFCLCCWFSVCCGFCGGVMGGGGGAEVKVMVCVLFFFCIFAG